MTKPPLRILKTAITGRPYEASERHERLEELAREIAREDAVSGEALLDSLIGEAIKQWRIQDAAFWERVRFRSRMIRAAKGAGNTP